MRTRALILLAALLASSSASAQDLQCPPDNNVSGPPGGPCRDPGCCGPPGPKGPPSPDGPGGSPNGGGSKGGGGNSDWSGGSNATQVGDPVNINYGSSQLARTDVSVMASTGKVEVKRFYSHLNAWNGIAQLDDSQLLPFGKPRRTRAGPEWWLSVGSFVRLKNYNEWIAVDTAGRTLEFGACGTSASCLAHGHDEFSSGIQERLGYEAAVDGGTEGVFTLYVPGGGRYVYEMKEPADSSAYLLTAAYAPDEQLLYTVSYKYVDTPSTSTDCTKYSTDPGGREPVIDAVTTADGTALTFGYSSLLNEDDTDSYCRLTTISTDNTDGGSALPTVTYAYEVDGGPPFVGNLISVTLPNGAYEYVYSDAGFEERWAGATNFSHGYNTSMKASTVSSSNQSWSADYHSADNTADYCGPDSFSLVTRTVTTTVASGDYGAPETLTRDYTVLDTNGLFHDGRVQKVTDSCNGGQVCSEGTVEYVWSCDGGFLPDGGNADRTDRTYERAVKNKRGNYSVRDVTNADAGAWGNRQEVRTVYIGAEDPDGLNPESTTHFSYAYSSQGQQLVTEEKHGLSVVDGTTEVKTLYFYDSGNLGILQRKEEVGVTRDISGASQSRTVQTMYRRTRSCGSEATTTTDPLNRTLEIEGPCLGSGGNCPGGAASGPITQFVYYDSSAAGWQKNRLHKIIEYPGSGTSMGCSGTALVTEYLSYDAFGNPLSIKYPDNQTLTMTRDAAGQVTTSTLGGLTYEYGYDNGKLWYVKYPSGAYEVSCYRTSSDTSCSDAAGTWTQELRWRAKGSGNPATGSFTAAETVEYTYWDDGTPKDIKTKDGSGSVRVHQRLSSDAHRRLTYMGAGDNFTDGGTDISPWRAHYDGADNLTAVGFPYNAAPSFCWDTTSSAISDLCHSLAYDRSDRVTSLTRKASSAATAATTCFRRDTAGNIKWIATAAEAASTCASLESSWDNTEAQSTSIYEWDDFGNLVASSPSDTNTKVLSFGSVTGSTAFRWEYDARGNATKKQTPTQKNITPTAETTDYTYDGLGRLLKVQSSLQSNPAYQFTWDSATACSAVSGSIANTAGRLAATEDSYGWTWYSYTGAGQLAAEYRSRSGSCGTVDDAWHTLYTYNLGRLATLTYPHGRVVRYAYQTANPERIDKVEVDLVDPPYPAANGTNTLINNVTWEPFGGLQSYGLYTYSVPDNARLDGGVEYLLGDVEAGSPWLRPTSNDQTGRLRAIFVNKGSSDTDGKIFKHSYGWAKDQIGWTETYIVNESPNDGEANFWHHIGDGTNPAYDRNLQLRSGDGNLNGGTGAWGPYDDFVYNYDARGNRGNYTINGNSNTNTYDDVGKYADHLVTHNLPNAAATYSYEYDDDGRVSWKKWKTDSSGSPAFYLNFGYATTDGGTGDTATYKTVSVNGATYSNFYDAFGRRRKKVTPFQNNLLIADEEFFYSFGSNQLLEDRGSANKSSSASAKPWPIDEYIWLGGRPVAIIRSAFTTNTNNEWIRLVDSVSGKTDLAGDCKRDGESTPCGIYYPITDVVGRPLAVLNSSRKLAATANYDPFGHPNRVQSYANRWNYSPNQSSATWKTLSLPSTPGGETVKLRLRFHFVDTEQQFSTVGSQCIGAKARDFFWVTDSTGANITTLGATRYGGVHAGPLTTPWFARTESSGDFLLKFTSNATDCSPTDVPPNCGCTSDEWTYSGVSFEGYDYRRYETGATWFLPPIRSVGQYYDSETDMFENWNRFYDPAIGRYLAPEPLVVSAPNATVANALAGRGLPAYSFVENNPLTNADPTGGCLVMCARILVPSPRSALPSWTCWRLESDSPAEVFSEPPEGSYCGEGGENPFPTQMIWIDSCKNWDDPNQYKRLKTPKPGPGWPDPNIPSKHSPQWG